MYKIARLLCLNLNYSIKKKNMFQKKKIAGQLCSALIG